MAFQAGQDPFAKTTAVDVVDALWFKVKNIVDGRCADVDEVAQLDSKISQILLHLRSFRNSLTPINSLPDELLTSVFESALYTSTDCSNNDLPDELTQVCRRWRSVAMADPPLWSNVRISDKKRGVTERTLMYLTRSKGFPISVCFDSPRWILLDPRIEESGDLLNPHSSRIRKLVLESLDVLPILEGLSLPNLEFFKMPSGGHTGISALHPIFHGNLPRLRHLRLTHFSSWPPHLFQNLVTLQLSHQSRSVRVTMSMFMDLLEGSPLLEQLYIFHHGPVDDGTAPTRVATLPRLLDVNLKFCHSRAILSHVKLPPSVKITIHNSLKFLSSLDDDNFDGWIDLTLAIAEDLIRAEMDYLRLSVGFEEVAMSGANQKGLGMRVSEHLVNFSGVDRSGLFRLTLESVVANLMFKSVTTLVFDIMTNNDNIVSAQTWEGVLNHFSSLEFLEVDSPSTSNLFKVLHSDVIDEAPICPTLKKFVLTTSLGDDSERWFEDLSSILEYRRTGGCPIDLVLMLKCLDRSLQDRVERWTATLKELGLKEVKAYQGGEERMYY